MKNQTARKLQTDSKSKPQLKILNDCKPQPKGPIRALVDDLILWLGKVSSKQDLDLQSWKHLEYRNEARAERNYRSIFAQDFNQ